MYDFMANQNSRFPRGKRGLKLPLSDGLQNLCRSLPSREAWIEMGCFAGRCTASWSLPSREAWIEITLQYANTSAQMSRFPRGKRGLKLESAYAAGSDEGSLPSREAWIEMILSKIAEFYKRVASLAGSVD